HTLPMYPAPPVTRSFTWVLPFEGTCFGWPEVNACRGSPVLPRARRRYRGEQSRLGQAASAELLEHLLFDVFSLSCGVQSDGGPAEPAAGHPGAERTGLQEIGRAPSREGR